MDPRLHSTAQQHNCFTTYSGVQFNLCAPTVEMVRLEDIAHALSHTNRYGGHLPFAYSVAQHSVHVMECALKSLQRSATPEEATIAARVALLHDAHEAYCGDVISPLKDMLPGFAEIEDRIQHAVWCHFGVPNIGIRAFKDLVHAADTAVFAGECRSLRGWAREEFALLRDPSLYDAAYMGVDIATWTPGQAKQRFLRAAAELDLK